ncbi:hypothetical protein LLB_2089 [Legionella longbeachae D-4968]|nr:hypothetical protein LLB_2089 [Legionella longbeachae D-4968]
MKGFKEFHSAKATLSGIELHHMLRKKQHLQAPSSNNLMALQHSFIQHFSSLSLNNFSRQNLKP